MDTMHPVFTEGYDAWLNGVDKDQCPYAQQDHKRRLWLNGWDAAFRQENGSDEAISEYPEG